MLDGKIMEETNQKKKVQNLKKIKI